MKLPLYSDGHIEEAKVLFPDRVKDYGWLRSPWVTDEINKCKELYYSREIFPLTKDQYESFIGLNPISDQNQEIANYVIKNFNDKSIKILSIGCGYGEKEIALSRNGYKITALDNSPLIGWLRDKYADEVDFISSDAKEIPFGNNSFDLILLFNVIYAIPNSDLERLFAEIDMVLKINGGFIISSSATIDLKENIKEKIRRLYCFLTGKEKKINPPQEWKQTGWLRDKEEIEKYMHFSQYKKIRYDNSVCLSMRFSKSIASRIAYFICRYLCHFKISYQFWVAENKK